MLKSKGTNIDNTKFKFEKSCHLNQQRIWGKGRDLLLIRRDGGEREKLELEHLKRDKNGSAESCEESEIGEEREKGREN